MTSLIDKTEFQKFTGVYPETEDTTQDNYLDMAQEIAENYLGFLIDDKYTKSLPVIIKQTIFRIAALLQLESSNNIGINSKSFGDSGSRSFLNVTNYSSYLIPLAEYRLANIVDGITIE